MSLNAWSWLLFAVSTFGLWLSGQNPVWGWRFAAVNQLIVWVPYGVLTGQWGTVAMSAVFTGLYLRNLRRWRGTDLTPARSSKETADA